MAISDLSDDDLRKKMSQRLIWLEAAYAEMTTRLDKAANGDQMSGYARAALKVKQIWYRLKDVHIDASIVESEVLNQPMPRSGER